MRRAFVAALLAMCAVLVTVPSAGAALRAPASPPNPVVVFLAPGLEWSDVRLMPHLQALVDRGAVGVLSVRGEGETTGCSDGFLEISAMTRVPTGRHSCLVDRTLLPGIRERYRHGRYGAQVGLLGDLSGGRIQAADVGSEPVAAPSRGQPNHWPSVAAAVHGGVPIVVTENHTLYGLYGSRDAAARNVDGALAAATGNLPPDATVVVAGSSDGLEGGPSLHPIVIAGPSWPHRELTSASTGRAPFVQLIDLGPTLLAMLGVTDLPTSVAGRPMRASDARVASLSSYADLDRHAREALSVGHPTFTGLCVALLVALLLLALRRREAGWVARLLVAAPLATWLVQLLPWWRWSLVAYALVLAALSVAGAFVWRFVPAATAFVLLADQLLGAPLQLAAPFGDNPIVAGRFHGMGNIAFGVVMGSLLLCAAATRRWAVAAALLAVGVVIDGAPMLGDDVGGVLALVPAAVVLVAALAQVRVSLRRAVAAAVVAVGLVVAAAAADYARPQQSQTHIGRFVGQVLHGGAWRVVHRKLDGVLGSFTNPVVVLLVVACLALAVLLLRRRSAPAAAVAAAVVLGLLGSALNDSGVFVGAAVALAVAPPLLAANLRDTRSL